jgi:hypothetical protein
VIGATSRPLIVHTPRAVDEARAILEGLLVGHDQPVAPRSTSGVTVVDGAVESAQVSFTAMLRQASPLQFTGTIGETPDGSVLVGSLSAPMALGWPAAILTVLVALFLARNGIPLPLVGLAALAWIFLSVVVVNSLEEQRLSRSDLIQRWLEDALAGTDTLAGTNGP